MSERISCPGCQRFLSLPRDCVDPWLACPGCATRIRNPQAVAITEQPAPEPDRRVRLCPSCRAGVEAHWRFCPHCEEPLPDPRQTPAGDGNLDVSQKGGDSERIKALLAMFGLMGIAIALLAGVAAVSEGNAAPLVVTLAVLLLLTSIGAAVVLTPGKCLDRPTAVRIFMSTLSLAGMLVAGGCLVSAAGFIFLLAVCLAG